MIAKEVKALLDTSYKSLIRVLGQFDRRKLPVDLLGIMG